MSKPALYLLDPGCEDARAKGCSCDPQEPKTEPGLHGTPRRIFRVEPACPIHGAAEARRFWESAE